MEKISREDIHLINQHSNWSENGIEKALNEQVYSNKLDWQRFLKLFSLSLGVGFSVVGIVFFFAYNWDDLHKFVKIGLIQGLILALSAFILFSKQQILVKNIVLTGCSVLVGVLFAVFSQVYQTGANAYDFFLGWTVFVAIWAIIANFAPLWLLFILLLNITLALFATQRASNWSFILINLLHFSLNAGFLLLFLGLKKYKPNFNISSWLTHLLTLSAAFFATLGIIAALVQSDYNLVSIEFSILALSSFIFYIFLLIYGKSQKRIFYIAIISLSTICILTAIILRILEKSINDFGSEVYLLTTIFIVLAVALTIKYLLNLQKDWKNEQ